MLMRLVDSNVPCMGKLYHRFFMLSRFAEAVAGDPDAIADIEEQHFAQVLINNDCSRQLDCAENCSKAVPFSYSQTAPEYSLFCPQKQTANMDAFC
jgi:hypothetical protein